MSIHVRVKIEVQGSDYNAAKWEGALGDAPATLILPRGMESHQWADEANLLRRCLDVQLRVVDRVMMNLGAWSLVIMRTPPQPEQPESEEPEPEGPEAPEAPEAPEGPLKEEP